MMQNSSPRTKGVRLREARERKRLTQEQLAEAAGIHAVTVSKYERDAQDPNTAILASVAKILDVSVDWILTEHEDIIHHGLSDREKSMKVVMSNPALALRVVEGTLSDKAISDLCDLVQFICWRDRRRRSKKDKTEANLCTANFENWTHRHL